MSGGLDSSVAAFLLKEKGFEVIGVTMKLHDQGETAETESPRASCCGLSSVIDARSVAARLGIRHYTLNYREDFHTRVITPFIETYLHGLTPSPCILCNSLIKFKKLQRFAKCLGVEKMATGHYAINQFDEITGRHLLCKGHDEKKDQSYFLYDLDQNQLERTLFPLGGMTKTDVRQLARDIGLPVAEKPESQEICFVPDGDYGEFIDRSIASGETRTPSPPGEIVRRDGTVLGRHDGIHHFTIGQRRGLGVAADRPLYVVELDPSRRRVVVGDRSELLSRRFQVTRCNWIAVPGLEESIDVEVKIRSRFTPAPATIHPRGAGGVEVVFATPQPAVTPGQAAVFYWGDVVVGGGWIYKTEPEGAGDPSLPPADVETLKK